MFEWSWYGLEKKKLLQLLAKQVADQFHHYIVALSLQPPVADQQIDSGEDVVLACLFFGNLWVVNELSKH